MPGFGAMRPMLIGVMLAYLAVIAAVAVWASRRTSTTSDYFAAGRRLGLWTLSISSMAATLSGFAFIGGPGLVYRLGMGAVWIVLPVTMTGTLSAWVLAEPLRRYAETHGAVTIPGVLRARYQSPVVQGVAAVAIALAVIAYTATNTLALGLVLEAVLGLDRAPALWLGAGITLAYSVAGGILAGVYADMVQGAVMAVASVLICWWVWAAGERVGGFGAAIGAADASWFTPFGTMSPFAAMSLFFVFGLGTLGQPHVLHKFLMVRDRAVLRWFPLVSNAAMLVSLLLFVAVGVAMRGLVAAGAEAPLSRPDDATPIFLLHHTPRLVAGLVFAATAAAIMSTVNSFLSVGAAALSRDLPEALGRPAPDTLTTARLWTIGIAVVAAIVAAASEAVVGFLGIFGWGLFAAALVPALALGLNWPQATARAAVASMLTGVLVTLAVESASWFKQVALPPGVTGTALALVASLCVFIGVTFTSSASTHA